MSQEPPEIGLWCDATATRWCDTPTRSMLKDVPDGTCMTECCCSAPMCDEHGEVFTAHVNVTGGCKVVQIDTCPACTHMRRHNIPAGFSLAQWREVVRRHAEGNRPLVVG